MRQIGMRMVNNVYTGQFRFEKPVLILFGLFDKNFEKMAWFSCEHKSFRPLSCCSVTLTSHRNERNRASYYWG